MTAADDVSSSPKDPVCGMSVDSATARHRADHGAATFYFCSARCRDTFVAEPARFLSASTPAPPRKPAPSGAIYTCPMHPEVRQVGPGHCSICGMALEPEVATAAEGASAELIDMTRRFRVALALTIPVIALEMGGRLIHPGGSPPEAVSNWLQLALATPVVV